MKFDELKQTVCEKTGAEPQTVQNVLETTFALLGEKLIKGEKLELEGLGTFVRKQNRKSGKGGRTLFRSWAAAHTKDKKLDAASIGEGSVNRRKKAKKQGLREYQDVSAGVARTAQRCATGNDGAQAVVGATSAPISGGSDVRTGCGFRPLVFHYHLFKNAGTSVDELLRRNFDTRWAAQEFNVNRRDNSAAVREFICSNPHLQAISSHTALLPVPEIEGVEIFPIIFIRHPIDRLRSAYEFERRQNSNTTGARLAKMHDFAGYLQEFLRNPRHRQIRNFQTLRLSQNELARRGSELDRAIAAIQTIPFVGLVERFDESLKQLESRLRHLLPVFRVQSVHRNAALSRHATLANRLTDVVASLGQDLYNEVCAANADDLAIYDRVIARFESAGMHA